MNLMQFVSNIDVLSLNEEEKVLHLAYYYLRVKNKTSFTVSDVCKWFDELDLSQPNRTRLNNKLLRSVNFTPSSNGGIKLHRRAIQDLDEKFPDLKDEDVVIADDVVLPKSLVANTRGYIKKLADQINASYEHNISDGCAVLMRRLLEVLLIHCYQHNDIEDLIVQEGNYVGLNQIISNAKTNKKLRLEKSTRDCLDTFRKVGNFSAHKLAYNCHKRVLKDLILEYKATIEELLYKSGLK